MNLDFIVSDLVTDDPPDKKKRWWLAAAATIGLTLFGSVLYALEKYSLIEVNSKLPEILPAVLGKYLLLVVAFERAAAVFVERLRRAHRVDWPLRINRLTEILKKKRPSTKVLELAYVREEEVFEKLTDAGLVVEIPPVGSKAKNDDYVGYLTAAKHAYEFQRARYDSAGNRRVARTVFLAGLFLATLGVSLFADVFTLSKDLGALHRGLLRAVDILVTGGLLGGGSGGLHAAVTKVREFSDRG